MLETSRSEEDSEIAVPAKKVQLPQTKCDAFWFFESVHVIIVLTSEHRPKRWTFNASSSTACPQALLKPRKEDPAEVKTGWVCQCKAWNAKELTPFWIATGSGFA